jgi:hypothetical protein
VADLLFCSSDPLSSGNRRRLRIPSAEVIQKTDVRNQMTELVSALFFPALRELTARGIPISGF